MTPERLKELKRIAADAQDGSNTNLWDWGNRLGEALDRIDELEREVDRLISPFKEDDDR